MLLHLEAAAEAGAHSATDVFDVVVDVLPHGDSVLHLPLVVAGSPVVLAFLMHVHQLRDLFDEPKFYNG